MSYSYDLRRRVVVYVLGGGLVTRAAKLFGVHRQTVQNWMRMERSEGLRAAGKPGPKGGQKVTEEALRQAVSDRPDARLKELGAALNVHPSTICYACKKWGLSRKKTWGYTERDDMKRRAYLRLRERYRRRGKSFVYADESGFEHSVTRRYGRAPKGQKLHGLGSGRSGPRTALIAARFEGGGFEAPILFEGTCNADIFNMWPENHLCPLLSDTHVVVIDNAAFHKSAATKNLIEKTGATLLFLPPYSPDFNPIENDFANLKTSREYNEESILDNIINSYN